MRTLLVTGASGFLGWHICREARTAWRVYGIVFSHPVSPPDCEAVTVDITDYRALQNLMRKIKPEAVIHTAATAQPNNCQKDPQGSYRINVEAPISLAGLCAASQIPFVFTSTDLVFDGKHPPYNEEAPVSPVSVYGEQKVTAERGIRSRHPAAAICRMPLMYGDPSPASQSFLQPMLTSFIQRKKLTLFTDEYRTPVSGYDAARGLLLAVDTFHGTIHLGGKQSVSRYEFGMKVADFCGFDTSLIHPCMQKEITMAAPRPPDVSLDSARAFGHGYAPLDFTDAFAELNCLDAV